MLLSGMHFPTPVCLWLRHGSSTSKTTACQRHGGHISMKTNGTWLFQPFSARMDFCLPTVTSFLNALRLRHRYRSLWRLSVSSHHAQKMVALTFKARNDLSWIFGFLYMKYSDAAAKFLTTKLFYPRVRFYCLFISIFEIIWNKFASSEFGSRRKTSDGVSEGWIKAMCIVFEEIDFDSSCSL